MIIKSDCYAKIEFSPFFIHLDENPAGMINSYKNSQKTVLISGAAGGLGSKLVKIYSEQGFRVIATDIDVDGLSKLSSLANVLTKTMDITDNKQLSALSKDLDLEKDGLDIMLCLAGIYAVYPVTEADPELFGKMLAVNFQGTASLVSAFLGPLIRSKGRVIIVSSESYKIQAMFQPYMISKAALEAWCRVANQELALKGVSLTVVRPGAIDTALLKWMRSPLKTEKYPIYSKELKKSWESSIKMVGKIISPDKVAVKIFNISTAKNLKRFYHINNSILLMIISYIPVSLFDRLVIRKFKIKD